MNIITPYFCKKNSIFALLMVAFVWTGCASTQPLQNPTTEATLWVQNSAEYAGLTTAIYQAAAANIDTALHTPAWTALLNPKDDSYRSLPPAIVLDVDETVLDNSPFQARLIKQQAHYTSQKWARWVREEKAEAIPGAVALTQKAADTGITVFYITNRDASLEQATYDNLKKQGFPLKDGVDVVLTKNEQPGWTSAKVNRRKFVAKKYRILMLFGDNLNDLLSADDITNQERKNLVQEHQARFGRQWYVLPNPTYGSWQQALYNFNDSLSAGQVEKQRMRMLHTKN